jgi:AcrR family transcriptional regulator
MARAYTLKRRGEQQAQTRQKIVEAAVELHGTVGPARTTLSMVAELAGVQRNTLYAHFPDERSLLMACSGLSLERAPPPDAQTWTATPAGAARLSRGLGEIYGWFAGSAPLLACVLRDAEHYPPVQEIAALRYGPVIGAWHAVLGEGLNPAQQALLHLSLSFHGWRALAEAGLDCEPAAALMARTIETAA